MVKKTHNRLEDLAFQLSAIDLLKLAKQQKDVTYQVLSKQLGYPVSVLNRYIKGYVLPTSDRAKDLRKKLSDFVKLQEEVAKRIQHDYWICLSCNHIDRFQKSEKKPEKCPNCGSDRVNDQGYFDNTSVISNISLMRLAAQHVLEKFVGKRINLVLTAAVDGIPLAVLVANLFNKDLVIAKKEREVGVKSFLEEAYVTSNSAVMTTLYVPKDLIRRGDGVIIVDDIMRSGETQRALINLIQKARAEVAGVFVIIAVGDEWKRKIPPSIPVEFVYKAKS